MENIKIIYAGVIASILLTVTMNLVYQKLGGQKKFWEILPEVLFGPVRGKPTLIMAMHLLWGVIFSFLYVAVWSLLPISEPFKIAALACGIGVIHGLAVANLAYIMYADDQPKANSLAGQPESVAIFSGHLVFGLVLGLLLGFSNVSITPLKQYSERFFGENRPVIATRSLD